MLDTLSRPAEAGTELWTRYTKHRWHDPELGLTLDVSRVRFPDRYLGDRAPALRAAADALLRIERGEPANRSEGRMVGHYWLRAPEHAPTPELEAEIREATSAVLRWADAVTEGAVRGTGGRFEHAVYIGIGGSALGPQLVCDALGSRGIEAHFLDNADRAGVEATLSRLHGRLGSTLVSVVSKSGVTPTPMHVTAMVEAAFRDAGLQFPAHAVATTMPGSDLDTRAREQDWLARFPVWDWVGGRTSVSSAVGMLPAALAGVDVGAFLAGAAQMDRSTRALDVTRNPALLLASMWFWLGHGRGDRSMVVLPYRDRLALLPRYIQQLVMESLGKRHDRAGNVVQQGLTVYGHKGSSDQHSYVQQLRDGRDDCFVTFVVAGAPTTGPPVEVEPGLTLDDFLFGSMEGTRDALYSGGRDSILIELDEMGPRQLGALIALFERAVGLYAELIDVNAYDQPGVDKFAAHGAVRVQQLAVRHLRAVASAQTAEQVAVAIGMDHRADTVFRTLRRLARDGRGVVATPSGADDLDALFIARGSTAPS